MNSKNMERRKKKKYDENVPLTITGMKLDEARIFCTSRGYILNMYGERHTQHETYLVTVITIDENGIIKEAKYGK